MAKDTNYSPEQQDSFSTDIAYMWWCQKCLDYHYGLYDCPYEDYEYCPHCGQLIKRANEGGLG